MHVLSFFLEREKNVFAQRSTGFRRYTFAAVSNVLDILEVSAKEHFAQAFSYRLFWSDYRVSYIWPVMCASFSPDDDLYPCDHELRNS
jgi:hypothetical protein